MEDDYYALLHSNNPVILANAFSLNMLGKTPSIIEVYEVPIKKWGTIARGIEGYGLQFDCAIGHESTIQVYNFLFDARFTAQRKAVKMVENFGLKNFVKVLHGSYLLL